MTELQSPTPELDPELTNQKEAVAKLLALRGNKFSSPDYLRSGGVRNLYRTNWGPHGEKHAVVKVDRTHVSSPRAIRHLERGCTTGNELEHVIALEDNSGITRIVDYFGPEETARVGLSGTVIVEEYIENACSLEEWVQKTGPLSPRQWRQFARSYVETAAKIVKEGVLHRDHKASNILLVKDKDGNITTKITDWANACRINATRPSVLPTAGGHLATSPRIMGFDNEETAYTERDEVYGITSNLAYAARGTPIVEYDPDKITGVNHDTGRSILTDGKVDMIKHAKALRRAVKKLPRKLRRYGHLICDGMDIGEHGGYQTLESFALNVKVAAQEPSTWKTRAKWAGLAATIALTIGGAGLAIHRISTADERVQKSEEKAEYERKINVIRDYLGKEAKERWETYVDGGELQGWVNLFKDERTGMAAYMDPVRTYEAIQETGSEDYEVLKQFFCKYRAGDSSYFLIHGAVSLEAPGGNGSIDNIARTIRMDRYEKVKDQWAEARKAYEEKRAQKNKPIGPNVTFPLFPNATTNQ